MDQNALPYDIEVYLCKLHTNSQKQTLLGLINKKSIYIDA